MDTTFLSHTCLQRSNMRTLLFPLSLVHTHTHKHTKMYFCTQCRPPVLCSRSINHNVSAKAEFHFPAGVLSGEGGIYSPSACSFIISVNRLWQGQGYNLARAGKGLDQTINWNSISGLSLLPKVPVTCSPPDIHYPHAAMATTTASFICSVIIFSLSVDLHSMAKINRPCRLSAALN